MMFSSLKVLANTRTSHAAFIPHLSELNENILLGIGRPANTPFVTSPYLFVTRQLVEFA
jgi:hypothetical protein